MLRATSDELGQWTPAERARVIDELREQGHLPNVAIRGYCKSGETRELLGSLEIVERARALHSSKDIATRGAR